MGARSKRLSVDVWTPANITRVPLWGRDQNTSDLTISAVIRLPECPCGGEIKTWLFAGWTSALDYQSALVGARSKRVRPRSSAEYCITRVPLWGRDQKHIPIRAAANCLLPECPCGGEIKTAKC